MGFGVNQYATVKNTVDNDGRLVVHLTTAKKAQDGKYHCDFSSRFVRFVGKAREKKPIEGDRIKILNCVVENAYFKDGKTEFTKEAKYTVFDYEFIDHWDTDKKGENKSDDDVDDGLPF